MEEQLRERKHHIYLSAYQREELKSIISHDTPSRSRRARLLLLVDEGFHGPALSFADAAERVGVTPATVSHLVERTILLGVKQAAIGLIGEASKKRVKDHPPRPRSLTPEEEKKCTGKFATGKFTKAELARRAGVHESTMGRIIRRNQEPGK